VLSRASELSDEELHQITDDMVTQVDELAALVTDLGELARGERSEGSLERLRLDDCVDECVETARTYARIRDITIAVEMETSYVQARHDRLNRAISNLLTNAVKFTPEGGRITVRSRARSGLGRRQWTGHHGRRPPVRLRPVLAFPLGTGTPGLGTGTLDRGPGG